MEEKALELIQEQIGYKFENKDLLVQAFIRRSYANENGGEDNEVLEFIGDSALGIVVVKILTERYGFFAEECDDYNRYTDPNQFISVRDEGELTELKKNLVKRETLAARIDELGFAKYLIMGKGDIANQANEEDSVKEDLFEAIIGAVTLDSKWNFDNMLDVVDIMLKPDEYLDQYDNCEEENYIELVQKWVAKKYKCSPRYTFIDEDLSYSWYYDGFYGIEDDWHDNAKYICILILGDFEMQFRSSGETKKAARRNVCQVAYKYLKENNLFILPIDAIGEPDIEKAVNQLQMLYQKKYIGEPWYEFSETHNENGNPVWHCECHVTGRTKYWYGDDFSSKKKAKKSVAYSMLCDILGWEDNHEA